MTCEVDFHETTSLRFTLPVMSSTQPPIQVTQSVNGAFIRVAYDGKIYEVSVERLAVAIVSAIRETQPDAASKE